MIGAVETPEISLKPTSQRGCTLKVSYNARGAIEPYFSASLFIRSRPFQSLIYVHATPDQVYLHYSAHCEVWNLWVGSACFTLTVEEMIKVREALFVPLGLRIVENRPAPPVCST